MKNLNNFKKPIFVIAIVFMTVTIFMNWKSSDKKDEAQKKLQIAMAAEVKTNQKLILAMKDSSQLFKKESEEKNKTYENNLSEYKAAVSFEKKETKIKNEKTLAEIEQKNNDMIKRLSNYKEEGTENLELFRYEIGREMNELGKSITETKI